MTPATAARPIVNQNRLLMSSSRLGYRASVCAGSVWFVLARPQDIADLEERLARLHAERLRGDEVLDATVVGHAEHLGGGLLVQTNSVPVHGMGTRERGRRIERRDATRGAPIRCRGLLDPD